MMKSCKHSETSAKNKLRKEIDFMLCNIGTEEDGRVSFDALGELLSTVGVFKVLYRGKKEGALTGETSFSVQGDLQQREQKEQQFHKLVWKVLTNEQEGANAEPQLAVDLLVLLHDANLIPAPVLAEVIMSTMRHYNIGRPAGEGEEGAAA